MTRHLRLSLLVVFTWAVVLSTKPAGSEGVSCPDSDISVSAPTFELQTALCQMASETVASLSSCHLPQVRPIDVEVVDEIAHPFATCLAAYDCDYDRIRIVVQDDYTNFVEAKDPYASFPPHMLVRSLLVHEITHALIDQNTADWQVPLVDHEYIAAAMEMEQMSKEWRERILDYAALDFPSESRINIWLYRLAPRRFAANSWMHFRLPDHGCDLVRKLIAGDTTFERSQE